jgi:hypothetical protein
MAAAAESGVRRTSPATAVPAFLPPCYKTGVVAVNGRLTTDQADVMMVVGNGRWARTAYHGVSPTVQTVTVSETSAPQHDGSLRWLTM